MTMRRSAPTSVIGSRRNRQSAWAGTRTKSRGSTARSSSSSSSRSRFGYAAGIYYDLFRSISPGVEFYGGIGLIDDVDPLEDQQHYIMPMLRGGRLPYGLEYNVGAGFGLTRGSDDIVTKVNIEFEKFVGRLFG